MSIKILSNLGNVFSNIKTQLENVRNPNYLLRPVVQEQIRLMHNRIHEQGKASDGNQIGVYSPGYLKMRSDQLPPKFTKGAKKGQARPKYNRSTDPKIIVSLTRQLENDYAVIATPKGYGIGFNNEFNLKKMRWVEAGQRKPIANMTPDELNAAIEYINELTQDALNS